MTTSFEPEPGAASLLDNVISWIFSQTDGTFCCGQVPLTSRFQNVTYISQAQKNCSLDASASGFSRRPPRSSLAFAAAVGTPCSTAARTGYESTLSHSLVVSGTPRKEGAIHKLVCPLGLEGISLSWRLLVRTMGFEVLTVVAAVAPGEPGCAGGRTLTSGWCGGPAPAPRPWP